MQLSSISLAISRLAGGGGGGATDPYWPYVSMLLHGDGANAAQNNTFLDGSTNNFTVTRNGNTTQGSFNPFVSTYPYAVATNGGSGYFDGAGDYLSLASNAALLPGAGDFTFECWVLPTTTSQLNLFSVGNAALASSFSVYGYPAPSTMVAYTGLSGSTVQGPGFVQNVWNHIAVVRLSNSITVYTNGVGGTAVANSQNLNESTVGCYVGAIYNVSVTVTPSAYISNARFVKGTAIYTANFTPPTAPLTAVTNTALLLGMSNGAIYDNTMLNNLETVANAQISTSTFKYGTGSVALNGTTDVALTPAKTAFTLGSGDFTVECWINQIAVKNAYIAGQGDTTSTTANTPWFMYINTSRLPQIGVNTNGGYWNATSSTAVTLNTWTHIAAVRDGATLRIYVNGVQTGTSALIYTLNTSSSNLGIGNAGDSTSLYFNGYIDDFRFTKGICRYPSGTTFTPPTAAFPNQGTTTYPVGWLTQRAIFGFGSTGSASSITNLVSNTGVVAANTTGVGTARYGVAAATYGWDKAIFGYGYSGAYQSLTNLVSNTGVMATDTTGVGTGRSACAAASYGGDKVIFGYGYSGAYQSLTNLVSNTGVVSADVTGVGTARYSLAAVGYGTDKAIYAYGYASGAVSVSNLVSSVGVVATDTTGVGTARYGSPAATGYGYTGQAIFAYGQTGAGAWISASNLVSSTGVIATDTTGVGTARAGLAAARYGGGTAIFAYGYVSGPVSMSNLVSATGVIASDTTGVGTARESLGAAGYSA